MTTAAHHHLKIHFGVTLTGSCLDSITSVKTSGPELKFSPLLIFRSEMRQFTGLIFKPAAEKMKTHVSDELIEVSLQRRLVHDAGGSLSDQTQ